MKITKRQLRRIIKEAIGVTDSIEEIEPELEDMSREELELLSIKIEDLMAQLSESAGHPHGSFQQNVTFEWSRSGLTMHMMLDGRPILDFSRRKEVRDLIKQLENLLAGPMRTSP